MSAVNEVMRGKLGRLTYTYRYSAQPVIHRENVAEHSYWTAMIGVAICMDLGINDLAPKVAIKALLHDVEESMTGDLVREIKYFDKEIRTVIGRVEKEFAKRLFAPMGVAGENLQRIWENSKDDTPAGRIVALADLLCVIAYCDREMKLGNTGLEHIRKECSILIEKKFIDEGELWPLAKEAIQ